METRYLKEFVTLAQHLSFSEAAAELYISQSSLSKHIKALEQELGESLFLRTTRTIRLSEAGLQFLPFARKVTDLVEEADHTLGELRRRQSNALTIGVIQNPQYYDLARYMISFRDSHPALTFNLIESDEAGLIEMFRRKQFNLFTAFPPEDEDAGYCFMPMVRSRMLAIVRRDHPAAALDSVSLEDLRDEHLLLPTRNSTISRLTLEAFRKAGISPYLLYEGSSIGCVDLVKAGMGVSLHAREFAAHVREDPELRCIPIEPAIEFTYGMGYRKEAELTRAELLYFNHMQIYRLQPEQQ
ncbi:MAG: LysR family transcriptional regulator [Mogibacterium sp.]|nr:LysR family transcriptional regulator [Mogibacterium sp.]